MSLPSYRSLSKRLPQRNRIIILHDDFTLQLGYIVEEAPNRAVLVHATGSKFLLDFFLLPSPLSSYIFISHSSIHGRCSLLAMRGRGTRSSYSWGRRSRSRCIPPFPKHPTTNLLRQTTPPTTTTTAGGLWSITLPRSTFLIHGLQERATRHTTIRRLIRQRAVSRSGPRREFRADHGACLPGRGEARRG
jgi:hypothetical protein